VVERFLVARNPDADSSLPYLISLPLPAGPLILKARDTWPRTAKVYCHQVEAWPEEPEIVEDIPVRSCERRGVAIDLVLARGKENRSQLVFTRIQGGREAIFWQSARTTRAARPGVRVPRRRASGHTELTILVDTREHYPYRFARQQARVQRQALPAGDYGVEREGTVVAAVERKSLADLASSLVGGGLPYVLSELAALPRAALVIEDHYASVFKLEHVASGFIAELLASVQVRYPSVPIIFCGTRPLAEEWTFRFLGAALAFIDAETDSKPGQGC